MGRSGVAITTRNRPELLARCRAAWQRWSPPDFPILIVDDASDEVVPEAAFRFSENVGIARAKNKCIELLMDAGCEHLFLSDDDLWPTSTRAIPAYIADELPHLMVCWGKTRRVSRDPHYTRWTHPRGAALYVERHVIDKIGGMRPEFGKWGSEHVEWSKRIFHAGFTPWPFMDLTGSGAWWHSEDTAYPGESMADLAARRSAMTTVPRADRVPWRTRHALMEKFEGSTDFVPYREGES